MTRSRAADSHSLLMRSFLNTASPVDERPRKRQRRVEDLTAPRHDSISTSDSSVTLIGSAVAPGAKAEGLSDHQGPIDPSSELLTRRDDAAVTLSSSSSTADENDGESTEADSAAGEDEMREPGIAAPVSDDDEEEGKVDAVVSDPFEAHLSQAPENLKKKLLLAKAGAWQHTRRENKSRQKLDIYQLASANDDLDLPIPESHILSLIKRVRDVFSSTRITLSLLQKELQIPLFGYQDLLFCERRPANSTQLKQLSCLHILNHIYKTRRRVLKNNAKSATQPSGGLSLQDQGFTRPKVLVILPTREACFRWVQELRKWSAVETQENKDRFLKNFHSSEQGTFKDRSADFVELFDGHDDDNFKIGIKFTRKTMKLFAPFYSSDIILASPLGLRMAMGEPGSKKEDYDFLSSIEILLLDHADALLMQNWEHVQQIIEKSNLQPKEAHGCDFSRVREWYLDGDARFNRQTIIFSAFCTPELNSLFMKQMVNVEGRVKITHAKEQGSMTSLETDKQTFFRLPYTALVDQSEQRFKHFTTVTLPSILRQPASGTLIFVPSFFDFVRIRNYLNALASKEDLSFGAISEYTTPKEITRTRAHFFYGRHSLLLYTERAHHFHRYVIRGVKSVSFYGLPDNPIFYREIAGGFLQKSIGEGLIGFSETKISSLFSKWDVMKLERIVGTDRTSALLMEKGDTFEFV